MQVSRLYFCAVFGLAVATGCTAEPAPNSASACPAEGRTEARALATEGVLLSGPKAVGGSGDFLLRSPNAAYIISGTGPQKTYYHYGGILVDAVATSHCGQVTAEQFEELGILLGKLNLADVSGSTLRAFRAETVEVVNSGANGKAAHVRATGVDDYYWLVEYELIKRKFIDGGVKPLSSPFGIRVVIDYLLEPGADTLTIHLTLENLSERTQKFMAGPEMIVGDGLSLVRYGNLPLEFAGLDFLGEIPFWSAGSAAGSYAFAIKDARLATAHISGVNATFNFDQTLTKPLEAPPGGSAGMTMFFAAGARDNHSATRMLQPFLDEPLPDWTHSLEAFEGQVFDHKTGEPVSGATIDVQLPNSDGGWGTLDRYVSDSEGRFGPDVAVFGIVNHSYRLIASAPGRNPTEPLAFKPPLVEPLSITLPPKGAIVYDIADSTGEKIPAKISLFRDGVFFEHFFVFGAGEVPVAPGDYEVSVTRGWEYVTHQGVITVPPDGSAALKVQLAHVVDSSGYLSADTHVHSEPSPDSEVLMADRIRMAAAEGLQIPVATDHEIIHGIERGITESGLEAWVNTVSGQEFTATIPEHTTIFPMKPDGTFRGSPPVWYQNGLNEMFSNAYGRGAQIGILNHPRGGCSYLCLIGWDRLTATPTLDDPTRLGFSAETALWTWNFHAIEYMNGPKVPFVSGDPERSGLFDDWQSFLNHGHRIVALGASDVHGDDGVGMPRIYFGSENQRPELFHEQDLVDAIFDGNILVSTGAFARVTVNGQPMGSVVTINGAGPKTVPLAIVIEALPEIDITHFRIYTNCDEYGKIPATTPNAVEKYNATYPVTVTQDTNIVVAGFGMKSLPRGLEQFNPTNIPRFTTNAIFIDADGNGSFDPPGDKECSYTLD